MIDDGVTGRLFPRGDAAALAAAVRSLTDDREHLAVVRTQTFQEFCRRFSHAVSYRQMRDIYAQAVTQRHAEP